MAAIDDLKAMIAAVSSTLDEVKADVADLISKLPTAGSIDEAGVEELRAALVELQAKAGDVADDHDSTPPVG